MVLHPLKSPPRDEWRDLVPSHHFDNQPQGSSHFDILFSAAAFSPLSPVRRGQPSSSASTNANRSFRLGRVNFWTILQRGPPCGRSALSIQDHFRAGGHANLPVLRRKGRRAPQTIIETEHGRNESACLDIDQDIRITYQKQQYSPPALVSPGRQSTTFPSTLPLWIPLCSPLREHEKATLRIHGLFRLDTACPVRSHATP